MEGVDFVRFERGFLDKGFVVRSKNALLRGTRPRSAPMHGTRTRLLATTLLGFALVALLLFQVGFDALGRTLAAVDPVFLLFGVLAYAWFFIARGVRWRFLLDKVAPEANVFETTSLSAAGWLVSTFVPLKAGDVTRAAMLARRTRTTTVAIAGSVALERALDVIGIAIFSSLSLLILALAVPGALRPVLAEAVAFAWILPIAAVLTLLLTARLVKEAEPEQRWKRLLKGFAVAAEELWKSPKRLPALLGLSALTAFSQVAMFLFLIHAVAPSLPMAIVATGVPLFLLSFGVSLTPAHIGTYEAAFVAVFGILGVDAALLLPTALTLHLLTASIVTVLGTIGFIQFRLTQPTPPVPTVTPIEAGR
jgi:uncharacterized protein (TIRG00374 family)